jgi:uncharacterized protein (DUF885 family)
VTEPAASSPAQHAAAQHAAAQHAPAQDAAGRLAALGDEFFEIVHTIDPFTATQLGVAGFDDLVPDPSRDGAAAGARRIASIERRLSSIDASVLEAAGRTNLATLAHLAQAARSDLEHGLWEANASAAGYVSPAAMAFQSVPTAVLDDAVAVRGYIDRVSQLAGYFDRVADRYRLASRDGRYRPRSGCARPLTSWQATSSRTWQQTRLSASGCRTVSSTRPSGDRWPTS